MDDYGWTNLTSALQDRSSPLRRYLDHRFPDVRPLQQEFRKHAGRLVVNGGGADPAIVGAAFDYQVRFTLRPDYVPLPALHFFTGTPEMATVERIVGVAREAECGSVALMRAAWALALCTQLYREGLTADSPITWLLHEGRFTSDAVLGLAPQDGLRQLAELAALAAEELLPRIRYAHPLVLGPTFDASVLCAADADLIAGGLLLELKVRLGPRTKRTGIRYCSLPRLEIDQLLAYALFDTGDRFRIDAIGVYSARYGHFRRWGLDEALETMAGERVDLAAERRTVWRILGGPQESSPQTR